MNGIPFDIEIPEGTEAVVLTGEGLRLQTVWTVPQTRPTAAKRECWAHRQRETYTHRLAGRAGKVVTDRFTALGLELRREVWVDASGDAVAIRQKLRNRGPDPIQLDALIPVRCAEDGLKILDRDAGDWDVLAQKRLKNGIPSSFRPGVLDEDFSHVSKGMTELGDLPGGAGRIDQVEMDPCALLRVRERENSPVLLIGFLSQQKHCARLLMQVETVDEATRLRHLTAECEFDGCALPPGGERTSQWTTVRAAYDPEDLMTDFADRVGAYHGVKPPAARPPSVYCSWQFYGEAFNERDFHEDLAHLEKDRIPFDVFLIDDCWTVRGDYVANGAWPSGMADAAARIAALGYRPGIWTCPFIVRTYSQTAAEHPEWLLRLDDGSPHIFPMGGPNYVLDPTYPGVCDYLEDTFRRVTHDWGFTYHKFDFMRAMFIHKRIRFHNPAATRLEAYRMGLEAIRRGAGPDAYLSVCGGHYGGSLGIADSQRSGSDVASCWEQPPALPKFKQNLLRTWMSRLWHVDPDAMMVRRRDTPYNDSPHAFLSLGKFSDEEARTITLNQYLGGGMVCLCEKFLELDADRRALYRHVIPSVNAPSVPLNPFEPVCPSLLLTRVAPCCPDLAPWVTLAAVNWTDDPKEMSAVLTEKVVGSMPGSQFLVTEFFSQETLGIFDAGATIDLGVRQPHTSRLLRIAPWDGKIPVLAGTDLHFSGGGVEIAAWEVGDDAVAGQIETRWDHPLRVHAAFPTDGGYAVNTAIVTPDQRTFRIAQP